MKSRDSTHVLSISRLKKRYKQAKFSLNNNMLPWKGNTKTNVPKKSIKAEIEIFYKLLRLGCV